MALTAVELAMLRRAYVLERNGNPGTIKPILNAALAAIDNWWESSRPTLGTAIEAAAPGVFTNPQKAILVKHWLRQKFDQGG